MVLHLHFFHSQKPDPLPFFSHPLFSTVGNKHSNGWNAKKTSVYVSLYVSISRVKKIRSTEKFKNYKNVLKHLSLFLSSNSINFFHKAQNFLRTKIEQTSRPGVASCTINPNSAILCWLQFLNLKP